MNKAHQNDATYGIHTYYIARMRSGEGKFITLDGDIMEVFPGDVFFLPMGLRYNSYWHGDNEICWDSFAFTVFPESNSEQFPMQKIHADAESIAIMDKLVSYEHVCSEAFGLLYTIIGRLLPNMKRKNDKAAQLIKRAAQFLDDHPTATVGDTARYCNVSESGLYSAFRANGTTPVKLKQQRQVEYAIRMLTTTDLTVDSIAELCGFSSATYFLRILKRETGSTSKEIRNKAMM
ncbi:MAG: helix-turn-helix transcriptional regulator [Clostridiales bacterium]|nr:helix-turn-helix transcriptional regulator [Clostridiales bacterium]